MKSGSSVNYVTNRVRFLGYSAPRVVTAIFSPMRFLCFPYCLHPMDANVELREAHGIDLLFVAELVSRDSGDIFLRPPQRRA